MCLNECRAHSLSLSQNKMECTLNPRSLIHRQTVASSFAPTLTLTHVQCGRHPRSQSLEHRVEDTQTLSLTLSRTQNGCYTHTLTPHTTSYSHLSACSPSHTNNGGLILSNLPQPLTRKKRAHPRLTVTHPQIEGHTPLTLTSHTHRVEGVRLIHNYTCAHFQTHNGGLLLSQTHSRAISHAERRTHSLSLSLKHRMKHILTLTLTKETEWTAHSLTHTYSHSLTRRLEGTLTHTRRLSLTLSHT